MHFRERAEGPQYGSVVGPGDKFAGKIKLQSAISDYGRRKTIGLNAFWNSRNFSKDTPLRIQ